MENIYSVTTINSDFTLKREDYPSIGISICLPEFLDDLQEEELNRIFPAFARPTVNKSNSERRVSFTLKDIDIDMLDSKDGGELALSSFIAQHRMLACMIPGYHEYGVKRKEIEKHIVFCVDFMSHCLENDLYTVFFLFAYGGKMFLGTFSCFAEKLMEMRMVFFMCLDTIQFSSSESKVQQPSQA